ncbi:hypothetical protein GUITHDRAFT_107287 [Guillardia theta CCMP2712]|uniref:EF-hand domain-containing protein n=1 Tax=Guillardia theta (strain CCMP2712) TaxID=905079 RepID=L1JEM3_GUITC|nr:hypothetical protein GUITHDRAFT_107287 [Guillardia theta CCMP2712]EKX46936.1 hypothetical protein GUITHDRAFT_107287 [Guillardia theta CCMP2712]|eukprot:XP_005833916.1 hypothetical protein GUITHDRAFT_107287 [Guillardia theta CCMP2712]
MSVRGGSIKGENPVSLRLSGNSTTSTIYDGAMEVYSTKLMQWNGRRGVLSARYLSLYTNEIEEDFGTLKDIVATSEIDHVASLKVGGHAALDSFYNDVFPQEIDTICRRKSLQNIPGEVVNGSYYDVVFSNLDIIFTVLFTLELAVNMCGNLFRRFVSDGWSLFDLLVVMVSIVALSNYNLPGINAIRLLRAFRVIRLFGRLQSLRLIINSLSASIQPVFHAFFLMLLITSIYAILAVQLFGPDSPRNFGRFSSSLFTMFQVCTGDGWSSEIVRPLFRDNQGQYNVGVAFFFASFIVFVGWTLLQVVVAVLLENFTTAVEQEKEKMAKANALHGSSSPLDPLLASLITSTSSHELSKKINALFQPRVYSQIMDSDDSGSISLTELKEGFRKLPWAQDVDFTQESFSSIFQNEDLSEGIDHIDLVYFDRIIRSQLKSYVQRMLDKEIQHGCASVDSVSMLAMKLMLIEMENSALEFRKSQKNTSLSLEDSKTADHEALAEQKLLKLPTFLMHRSRAGKGSDWRDSFLPPRKELLPNRGSYFRSKKSCAQCDEMMSAIRDIQASLALLTRGIDRRSTNGHAHPPAAREEESSSGGFSLLEELTTMGKRSNGIPSALLEGLGLTPPVKRERPLARSTRDRMLPRKEEVDRTMYDRSKLNNLYQTRSQGRS